MSDSRATPGASIADADGACVDRCRMGVARFEVVGDVAHFRLTGQQELVDGVRQIADAIARTKAGGLDKLLVDIRRITGVDPPGIATRQTPPPGAAEAPAASPYHSSAGCGVCHSHVHRCG